MTGCAGPTSPLWGGRGQAAPSSSLDPPSPSAPRPAQQMPRGGRAPPPPPPHTPPASAGPTGRAGAAAVLPEGKKGLGISR